MSSFTLDDIRSSAEKKYGSTDITLADKSVCVLRNALRMSKSERDELVAIQNRLDPPKIKTGVVGEDGKEIMEDPDVDHMSILSEAIRLVAEDSRIAEVMLADVGDDLGMIVSIFDAYTAGTEAGEA